MRLLDFANKVLPSTGIRTIYPEKLKETGVTALRYLLIRACLRDNTAEDYEYCSAMVEVAKQNHLFSADVLRKMDSCLGSMLAGGIEECSTEYSYLIHQIEMCRWSYMLPTVAEWRKVGQRADMFGESTVSRAGEYERAVKVLDSCADQIALSYLVHEQGYKLGEVPQVPMWWKIDAPPWGSPQYTMFVDETLCHYVVNGRLSEASRKYIYQSVTTATEASRLSKEEGTQLSAHLWVCGDKGARSVDWFYKKEGLT